MHVNILPAEMYQPSDYGVGIIMFMTGFVILPRYLVTKI